MPERQGKSEERRERKSSQLWEKDDGTTAWWGTSHWYRAGERVGQCTTLTGTSAMEVGVLPTCRFRRSYRYRQAASAVIHGRPRTSVFRDGHP